MIGAGTLTIESAGENGVQTFEDVRDPIGVQQVLYQQMEDNENRKFDRVRAPAPQVVGGRRDGQARGAARAGPPERRRVRRAEGEAARRLGTAADRLSSADPTADALARRVSRAARPRAPADAWTCQPGSSTPGSARATTQPPKPAPVSRAPWTPSVAAQPLDQLVEDRGRHLEVVAQRRVARRHQRAGRRQVVGGERRGEVARPARTRCARGGPAHAATGSASALDRGRVGVAAAVRRRRGGPLALGASVRVGAADQLALLARVHHPDPRPRSGTGTGVMLERRAVDQERVALDPGGARELVHDPAGHAGRALLGELAASGELERRAVVAERQRGRHLERGARREPAAQRQVGLDGADQPDGRAELRGDPRDVATPRRFDRGGVVDRQLERHGARRPGRRSAPPASPPRGRGDGGAHLHRHRQHQPAHVVGVVADQVDPTRCARPHAVAARRLVTAARRVRRRRPAARPRRRRGRSG